MYRTLLAITTAILLTYGVGQTFAYTLIQCESGGEYLKWFHPNYYVKAHGDGFPPGAWRDALTSVADRWNSNPSYLYYSIGYDTPSVGEGNGVSEVWWGTQLTNNAPAVAVWYIDTQSCTFMEVDIIFDANVAYHYTTNKTDLLPYGGPYRPFQTAAMHEFGHAAGLGHTADTYSIMGQDWTHIHANGKTATAYPGQDAFAGIVQLYGLRGYGYSFPTDLGVVHWRWTGSSGEYSTHGRTKLFDSAGLELAKLCTSCAEGDPHYWVPRGQPIQLELTYEDISGLGLIGIAVGYYLSTDSTITTADTFLGSTTLNLPSSPVTLRETLTIPSTLSYGNYWLGAIIDYTGAISEVVEGNNATDVGAIYLY